MPSNHFLILAPTGRVATIHRGAPPPVDRCVIPAHLLNLGDDLGVSIARFRDRVTSSIGARRLLSKLAATAFLTFSRRASATVIAAEELVAAGLASLTTHPNNEFKLALKK